MNVDEYLFLYEKFVAGQCTSEEKLRLLNYRDQFFMVIDDSSHLNDHHTKKRIFARISSSIDKPKRFYRTNYWLVAAAFLLITAFGLFLLKYNYKADKPQIQVALHKRSVTPTGNSVSLTLGDGQVIQMNNVREGVLAGEGNAIRKTGKQLIYKAGKSDNRETAINTINVPRGNTFQLTLADGSQVWLNAGSSLTYPVRFTGNERHVSLKGEAYFEVAKNKNMPFKVDANGVQVQVLGTHFNVTAYPEENNVKTTLLEGSVSMSTASAKVMITPGQQGSATAGSSDISVNEANIKQVMGWKDGYFIFHNSNIKDIMKQISRWYDLDVEYEKDFTAKTFDGTYGKNKDIDQLLTGLELTGLVHFKLQGRRITVMP